MRKPAEAFFDPAIIHALRITTVSKGTNISIEIYRRLRSLIEQGVLKAGDSLPSESALASIMCVGRTSLRTALSILYEDGYIETIRGKGSYVSGGNFMDQHLRMFPTDILLASERIALLGELRVQSTMCDIVRGDAFLSDMLGLDPGDEIVQFQQLYCLNGTPAVLSFYYFSNLLLPVSAADEPQQIYQSLAGLLHAQTLAAKYECLSVRSTAPMGLHRLLPRKSQTLVTTQFVGTDGPIVFSKDYYNNDIMRFRFSMGKLKIMNRGSETYEI